MRHAGRYAHILYAVLAAIAVVIFIISFLAILAGAEWVPVQISGSAIPHAIPMPGAAMGDASVVLNGTAVHARVAETESAREKGLGGVAMLAENEGMLFEFESDDRWAFWMKDMRIPLDIVWLSADKRVVYMAQNISPDTYPAAFEPPIPARYVLELPAGWAQRHDLKAGDTAEF